MSRTSEFASRYGRRALIVGASEGIGAAYAEEAATRGLDLILVARREEKLRTVADRIHRQFGVKVDALPADVGTADGVQKILEMSTQTDIGLLVYNAAMATPGTFVNRPVSDHLRAITVNSANMLQLVHAFAAAMQGRGRGGIIILCSMAGFQGAPGIATYGATKAFNISLAEALHEELKPRGVAVLGCVAGATSTPGYAQTMGPPRGKTGASDLDDSRGYPFWVTSPRTVARSGLKQLGRRAIVATGAVNRIAAFTMRHFFSRQFAARLMAKASGLME
jgi:hypothetical protein